MPMASTSDSSVRVLIEKPIAAMAAKAPMIVTGTVVAGTSVARQFCRNTTITMSTRIPASNSVRYTSWIEADTNRVVSKGMLYWSPLGKSRDISLSFACTSCATSSAFASGSWKMAMPAAGLPSMLKNWL